MAEDQTGSFTSVVTPIWSKGEPIGFDEFADTATGEVELAWEDISTPEQDLAPILVTAVGAEAFLVTWESIDAPADFLSEIVPATLAPERADMAALALTTYHTDADGRRREAIVVSCVGREGAVFREASLVAFVTRAKQRPPQLGEFEQLDERIAPSISRALRAGLTTKPPDAVSDAELDDARAVAEGCVPALQKALEHWTDRTQPLPMCVLVATGDKIKAFIPRASTAGERVAEIMKLFVDFLPWSAAIATEGYGVQEAEGREPARTWILRALLPDGDGVTYAVAIGDAHEEPTIAGWHEIDYAPKDFNEALILGGLRRVRAARETGQRIDVMSWLQELQGS